MKYNHSTKLENLTFENLGEYESDYLALDSQEIEGYLESVSFPDEYRKDITGVCVLSGDCEHVALWLTESNRPYDINAIYHPLPYYITEEMKSSKHLPDYWKESNKYYSK
jgi:hypothetical protein